MEAGHREAFPDRRPYFLGTSAGFLALSATSDRLLRKHRDWFATPTGNYLDAELQSASTWLNRHMPEVWDDIRSDAASVHARRSGGSIE